MKYSDVKGIGKTLFETGVSTRLSGSLGDDSQTIESSLVTLNLIKKNLSLLSTVGLNHY